MCHRPPLVLAILLLSFPQIVETIYSPALPIIAATYRTTPEEAAQTLSLWFFAFAFGVVFWGQLCDLMGRRPALLAGLALYALGSGWAILSDSFVQLLAARLVSAFGAAVGSIVTQTALRDGYQGPQLARVFSLLGIALAISPAIGMYAGEEIATLAGSQGVFASLGVLAILLLGLSLAFWPETRTATPQPVAGGKAASRFPDILRSMLLDREIWRNATLIAIFNLAIFGFYQLGPFLFDKLETRWLAFGQSGFVLALAALGGAFFNSALLQRGWQPDSLIRLGVLLLTIGAGIVLIWTSSPIFLIGMAVISWAYAMAIPNLLARALHAYAHRLGTAGAILSMLYYVLLGSGLVAAGFGQRLDILLAFCGVLASLLVWHPRQARR